VLRVTVLISTALVIVGLVWVLTTGAFIGALLIIGGLGGLGWSVVPDAIDRIAVFLSTGSVRRPSAK
jgi:hypothetical protein